MNRANSLDPITIEIIRNYLISSANQMRSVLIRASFNPVIYEMIDFSVGLYNKRAELIAEGAGLPIFMGTQTFAIRSVMEYFGEDKINEGDVLLTTYPYWTGSHSQDACVIKPIFVDGEIFTYAATKAHWMDLGAMDVYGVNTTDIWQEGLQLYGVRICKGDVFDDELIDVLRANSRVPDGIIGDLSAQIASCRSGEKSILGLVEKYGKNTVDSAIDSILDHGEQITRKAIADMPDGEWSAEGALDDNGIDPDPVKLRLTVRIEGERIIMDTTGSAPQQKGPTNCPYPSTVSGCRLLLKQLSEPLYPTNEGCFRPLEVIAPEGSVFNPAAPAPVFLYGWPIMALTQLGGKVLEEALPEKVVARTGGDMCGFLFSGVHPEDGAFFASGADECCGAGASLGLDGENALIVPELAAAQNVPVEVVEERYPVTVKKYELRQDSGGPGEFRGGLGVEKFYRAETDLSLVWIVEQTKRPAWGLHGGLEALPNEAMANAGTEREKSITKAVGLEIPKGEEWHVHSGGGGGWGNPFHREPESVVQDVILGYVSEQSAKDVYGVAVRKREDGVYVLDKGETEHMRAK